MCGGRERAASLVSVTCYQSRYHVLNASKYVVDGNARVRINCKKKPKDTHTNFGLYEVAVVAQQVLSGLAKDSDEVDVVRVPHYLAIVFLCHIPCAP